MDPGPDHEHHHHHHTGVRWLDMAVGLSAILISVVSLFVAIEHGKTMEHMVEATTWPYVEADHSRASADGVPAISYYVQNNGVGPAKIETFELAWKGRPLRDARDFLNACCTGPDEPKPHYQSSSISDRVLPAKESLMLFRVLGPDVTPEQFQKLDTARLQLHARVCYCSVLEECWLRDSERPKPEKVKACPAVKVGYTD